MSTRRFPVPEQEPHTLGSSWARRFRSLSCSFYHKIFFITTKNHNTHSLISLQCTSFTLTNYLNRTSPSNGEEKVDWHKSPPNSACVSFIITSLFSHVLSCSLMVIGSSLEQLLQDIARCYRQFSKILPRL